MSREEKCWEMRRKRREKEIRTVKEGRAAGDEKKMEGRRFEEMSE